MVVLVCEFLVVQFVFFFFPLVVVANCRGCWQWMWVLIGVMPIM